MQNPSDSIDRGRSPLKLTHRFAALWSIPELQPVISKISKNRISRPEFLELGEDQLDHATSLLIRLQNDLAAGNFAITHRNPQKQLATFRFVPTASHQAISQRYKLIFAHRAPHSEQQPIVTVQRIVHAILVA
jgi:hypothetical protein